jgi:hypothetical protein
MNAVWIALIAVGVSLIATFVALYAARVKAREGSQDVYSKTGGDGSLPSNCTSDEGGGGCD